MYFLLALYKYNDKKSKKFKANDPKNFKIPHMKYDSKLLLIITLLFIGQ